MGEIGLQMYSIREAAEKDFLKTIESVADMGYKGAQFAGFYEHAAVDVKAKMDACNIVAAGAHVPFSDLKNDLDATLKFHEEIGNRLIICPYLPEEMRTTADDYKQTAEQLNEIGRKMKQSGFTLGYHNHAFEFEQFNGKTGFDILFEHSDPAHLKMELDCFWVAYAGLDPLKVIEKYADRCASLHIKDMKKDNDKQISTELTTGILPLKDYINKGKDIDVAWYVVEQEHFSQDPLISAEKNVQALKSIV